MAYSVDWEGKVITIPQADLTFLSANRYKLDLDEFRRKCRALEADPSQGLSYPSIINYYPAVDTGDVILGRVVLIINGYELQLEDTVDRYSALFDGANTNLHNNSIITNGIPTPNNSAGLQDLSTLLSSAYNGEIVYNATTGQVGTATPIGTLGKPSNNWVDTLSLIGKQNAKSVYLQGVLTLVNGDDARYKIIIGSHPLLSNLIVQDASLTDGLIAKNLTFSGDLDGGAILEHCVLGSVINYFSGFINDCAMGGSTINVNGVGVVLGSSAGSNTIDPTILDCANATSLSIWDYNGPVMIINATNPNLKVSITMVGELYIDASCTEGLFDIHGDCKVAHVQTGNEVVEDHTSGTPIEIANAVFNTILP